MNHPFTILAWILLRFTSSHANSGEELHRDIFCRQYGAEAVITTSKLFVTTLPASTFVAKIGSQRGCVIPRRHWNVLRKKNLITLGQEQNCNKPTNTFAYLFENETISTIFCVDHIYADRQ